MIFFDNITLYNKKDKALLNNFFLSILLDRKIVSDHALDRKKETKYKEPLSKMSLLFFYSTHYSTHIVFVFL